MQRAIRVGLLASAVALAAAVAAPPASASAAHRMITVTPGSAMVNTAVTVDGTGFAANMTLTVQECGTRNWVVTQQACVGTNAVTVRTNARGAFHTTMTVGICPFFPGDALPHPTERRCFVGVPQINGVDTEHLAVATKLIVSWP